VVPFRRASGGIVFVNRGWITPELRKKADRPEGIVQVDGIVQVPHKAYFTPDNAPDKKDWYWIDTAAMAQAAKLAAPAPFIIDTPKAAAGVYPAGGALVLDIPNDHLQYAIFWFGMAAAAFAVYVLSSLQPAVKLEDRKHASV
jgi:surfeit locus 1 family protein